MTPAAHRALATAFAMRRDSILWEVVAERLMKRPDPELIAILEDAAKWAGERAAEHAAKGAVSESGSCGVSQADTREEASLGC